tara:strand:- start:284 stop:925 length:642 start_codon:yes stop_codon:yes gene_type:complete
MGKKLHLAIIVLILLAVMLSLILYSYFPDQIASHWNAKGEVDDYMSKFWGVFLFPFIFIGLYLIYLFIPKIDPLKKNLEKFRNYFDSLILVIMGFLFYVFILTMLWNLGFRFDMTKMIFPAIGFLFIFMGFVMPRFKRNWFVGIRTPWTISNDVVWNKTHRLGGKLFILSGIIALFGIFFSNYLLWFVMLPIIASTIWLVIYSYLEYTKVKKK